jgi:hypothetical protein
MTREWWEGPRDGERKVGYPELQPDSVIIVCRAAGLMGKG